MKFLNKVLLDGGLCISFFDFVSADDPYIYPAEGAVHQLINFRLVVFRPFVNEVLVGRVISSSREGLRVSLEFFDDILIPHTFLQNPYEYSEKTNTWNWLYVNDDEDNEAVQSLPYEINEIIRFKVRAVNINAPTTSSAKVNQNDNSVGAVRNRSLSIGNGEDMILPAMQVIGSVQGDGLGMCCWWS
jgi:DNA-directed RNA polymerase III subunit RPC8